MRVLSSLFEYHTGDTTTPDGEGEVFLRGNTPTAVPQYIPPPVEQHEYTVAVWVLSGLLVILSAVLVFVLVHIIFNHRRLRSMTLFPQRRQKAVQQRIDRRYETIEGWLISKRVQEHNDFCETCVREFAKFDGEDWIRTHSTMETAVVEESGSSDGSDNARVLVSKTITNKKSLEVERAHTKEKECPICFEEFAVGQVISYSPNSSCTHVFHHQCIKEWLVHHVTCPFCRKVCMHVDEYRGRQKHEHIEEMLELHSKRSATTYFCIQDGLVTIPSRIHCTNAELQKLQGRICDCIVDRKELATMRGGNHSMLNGNICGDTSSNSELSVAQEAVMNLEATSERDRGDFDPTEVAEDDIMVFAQGNVEAMNEVVNVEERTF